MSVLETGFSWLPATRLFPAWVESAVSVGPTEVADFGFEIGITLSVCELLTYSTKFCVFFRERLRVLFL